MLAAAAGVAFAAAFLPAGEWIGAATLWAVLVAMAYDARRLRGAAKIEARRTLPETVGLSRTFEREIELRCASAAGFSFELREAFPIFAAVIARTDGNGGLKPASSGDPTGGPDRSRFDERGRALVKRSYRVDRRGVAALGDVRIRVRGPLGLLEREKRLPARQSIRVRPALADLDRTLRLAASDRWRDLGAHRLRSLGGRSEFESLRDYVLGDDRRHVDWKASARRGRPMVRQFEVERGQELWLLIDCGRRMDARREGAGRHGWSKLDHALDAAFELAAVALSRGDRVGAIAFDDGVRAFVPARGDRAQFLRLDRALFALSTAERESDLARALRELSVRAPRRALALVLGEAADPLSSPEQAQALSSASRRHRVIFAALDDSDVQSGIDDDSAEPESSALERAALRAAVHSAERDLERSLAQLRVSKARILRAPPSDSAGRILAVWLDERRRQ